MLLIYSFLFCGFVCCVAQIILDNTKLSPGHITSFGHSLIHAAILKSHSNGLIGLLTGMFDMTATGISASIIFSFVLTLLFRPKN